MTMTRAARTWILRLALTAAALVLWWALARVSPAQVWQALVEIPGTSLALAILFGLAGVGVGGVRWKMLLRAFGARRVPSALELSRLQLIGLFYNTFLPANVMGDVLRAHSTRDAFDNAAGAYLIVLLERVFGLAGLLLLAGTLTLVRPTQGLAALRWVAFVGLLGAVAASLSPLLIRRLGGWLPGRLGALARAAPTLTSTGHLLGVVALSVLSHVSAALIGFAVLRNFASVELLDALVVIPVALIASYAPTVAGLGAREAAFVVVLGRIGVSESAATASSLAYLGGLLVLALLGGLLQLLHTNDARKAPGDVPRSP